MLGSHEFVNKPINDVNMYLCIAGVLYLYSIFLFTPTPPLSRSVAASFWQGFFAPPRHRPHIQPIQLAAIVRPCTRVLTSTWTEVDIQIVCVNMTQFSCEHKMSCLLTCMYLLFNERQSICLVLTWHPWCCETAAGTAALDTLRGLTRMMLTFVCVLLPRLFVCYWPRLFVCYFQRHWRVKTRNLGYVVLIIA